MISQVREGISVRVSRVIDVGEGTIRGGDTLSTCSKKKGPRTVTLYGPHPTRDSGPPSNRDQHFGTNVEVAAKATWFVLAGAVVSHPDFIRLFCMHSLLRVWNFRFLAI